MPIEVVPAFRALGIALVLGLLVGVQRQWSQSLVAGVRTFALVTLLGTCCAIMATAVGGTSPDEARGVNAHVTGQAAPAESGDETREPLEPNRPVDPAAGAESPDRDRGDAPRADADPTENQDHAEGDKPSGESTTIFGDAPATQSRFRKSPTGISCRCSSMPPTPSAVRWVEK